MTQKQILIAETLEEMGDTETMNIFNFRVTREEDVYVVDGQRMWEEDEKKGGEPTDVLHASL
jgi:hypothetical protein